MSTTQSSVNAAVEEHVGAGWRFLGQESYQDAVAELKIALRLQPGYPRALHGLALAYMYWDDSPAPSETMPVILDAVKANPGAWHLWDLGLGNVLKNAALNLEVDRDPTHHFSAPLRSRLLESQAQALNLVRQALPAIHAMVDPLPPAGNGESVDYDKIDESIEGLQAVVHLADKCEAYMVESWLSESLGRVIPEYPLRELAFELYRGVAESSLERNLLRALPDWDTSNREKLETEVFGRAKRVLVLHERDQESISAKQEQHRQERNSSLKKWGIGIGLIIWLVLLVKIPVLAIILAIGVIGGFVYLKVRERNASAPG